MQQQMAAMYTQMQQQQLQLAAALAQARAPAPAPAPSSGSAPKSSKVKPPPMTKFTGSVGPEVDTFLSDLEIQFEMFGPSEFPDLESRLRFARAYMSGTAAEWWRREDKAALVSWDKFVERLHERFRPLQAEDNALHRLRTLKQRGHVAAYCSLFQTILAYITDYPVKHQVFDFLEGLTSDDVRSRIKQAKPATLQAAMDMAISMEEYAKQSRGSTGGFQYRGGFRPSGQSPAAASSSAHVPMDINAVYADTEDYESGTADTPADKASIEAMVDKLVEARLAALHQPASSAASQSRGRDGGRFGSQKFSAEKERLYNENKCFKCKKPGHRSRECKADFQ